MNLPFNKEQFLDVFQTYNNSVFPAQIIFYVIALFAIFLAVKKYKYSDNIITLSLAFFWLWMGVVYHIIYFSVINKAAYIFGILYIIQSLLFLYYGLYKKVNPSLTFGEGSLPAAGRGGVLSFRYQRGLHGYTGSILMLYALIIYPAIGYLAGHVYPKAPAFGLPCPTTIFTFGMLLWTEKHLPVTLIIIPVIWSIIGFLAALYLGIYEDTGLLASGLIASILLLSKTKLHKKSALAVN